MNAEEIFNNNINPDTISVYEGRVIELDPNFEKNGYMYVDLVNPDSKDLVEGRKTSNRVTATFALRNCHNSWERPPEIKHKTNFMGSMNMTTSGDFHLKNYCFDMQTIQWFALVSTALNALGIVNVPPIMIGLDLTPFPGQAVSVNISQAVQEVTEESISNALKDLSSKEKIEEIPTTPSWEDKEDEEGVKKEGVKTILSNKKPTKNTLSPKKNFLLRANTENNTEEAKIIASVISLITDPIEAIIDKVFEPYYTFVSCIDIIFEIIEENIDSIENLTIPITRFASDVTGTELEKTVDNKSNEVKESIKNKIEEFKNVVTSIVAEYKRKPLEMIQKALYEPLAMVMTEIHNRILEVIEPIKKKLVELISSYIQEPINKLISFVSMGIQPIASALPNLVQLVIKFAIKKLLRVIIGKPIEVSIGNILDPAGKIIDNTIGYIQNKVIELVVSVIKSQVDPLVRPIQEKIISLIPNFKMDELERKLNSYLAGTEPLPEIYLGKDPLKPYIGFLEINWSDPEEVKALLLTLINLLPVEDLENTIVKLTNKFDKIKDWAVNKVSDISDFVSDAIPNDIKDTIYKGITDTFSNALGVDITDPNDIRNLVTNKITDLVGDLGPLQGVFDGVINGEGLKLEDLFDSDATISAISGLFTPDLFLDVSQGLDIITQDNRNTLYNAMYGINGATKDEDLVDDVEKYLSGNGDLNDVVTHLEEYGITLSYSDKNELRSLDGIYSDDAKKDIVSNSISVLKEFTPKEFLPLFEKKNPPVKSNASLGKGLFKDYDPEKPNAKPLLRWITNGVYYVTDKEGNKYIVSGKEDVSIPIYYPESEEVGIIVIPRGSSSENKPYYVYETEEVDHIPQPGEEDPSEGMDLVPKLYFEDGDMKPKILSLQDTIDSDNKGNILGNIGDLLYYYVNSDGSINEEIKGTYKELLTRCLQPIKQLDLYIEDENKQERTSLKKEFDDFGILLKENISESMDDEELRDLIKILKSSLLYKELTRFDSEGNYIYVTHEITKVVASNDPSELIVPTKPKKIGIEVCKLAIEGFDLSVDVNESVVTIENIEEDKIPEFHNNDPEFLPSYIKYEIKYNSEGKLISISCYMLALNKEENKYKWFLCQKYPDSSGDIELKGCKITFGIFNTSKITSYVRQATDGFTDIIAEDHSNPDAIMDVLTDMLSHAIVALGQEGDFDASTLIETLLKKVLGSVTGPLDGIIEKVIDLVKTFLEGYDILHSLNSEGDRIQETLNTLINTLNSITDMAKPALEATAKAASTVALQSCSMSQAATGKDFGFSSGNNYDLSTTTDIKSQLPYCRELKRGVFLEPNCKVLVLAVGAGKQNLYAVDILT